MLLTGQDKQQLTARRHDMTVGLRPGLSPCASLGSAWSISSCVAVDGAFPHSVTIMSIVEEKGETSKFPDRQGIKPDVNKMQQKYMSPGSRVLHASAEECTETCMHSWDRMVG